MNEQQSTRQAEADVTMPTPIGKRNRSGMRSGP